jgi:hypothetical protein
MHVIEIGDRLTRTNGQTKKAFQSIQLPRPRHYLEVYVPGALYS